MSASHDEHGHHEHDGGHELEGLDAGFLFKLIGVFAFIVLAAMVGTAQWFYKQRDELLLTNADEGWSLLDDYRAEMDKRLEKVEASRSKLLKGGRELLGPLGALPTGVEDPSDMLRRERATARGEAPVPAAGTAAAKAPAVKLDEANPISDKAPPAKAGAAAQADAHADHGGAHAKPTEAKPDVANP